MENISLDSDEKIVELSLTDDKYFEILVTRYERKLSKYIYRISGLAGEIVSDLLQEIFIRVYQNLNDFDDSFSFSSWIYRIAHNVTISYLRSNKKELNIVSINDESFAEKFIDLLPSNVDLFKSLEKKNVSEIVNSALMKLPEKYREVLVLFYLEEKSYKEISDILKRSIDSVAVLINRAKSKLKPELKFLID